MSKESILVVEDDKHISKFVKYNFEKAGFECIITTRGEKALEILDQESIDLIILDIMLPEMSGLEVCKRIKQKENTLSIPVVMLTAKGEEIDRLVGFESGADDYVIKPFSPRELVLRVKAILKRSKSQERPEDVLFADKLKIDVVKHKVTIDKKKIELTPMEFNLLITLMRRKGKVQSRDLLLEEIWDIAADVTTRTVDTHIKRLRNKLGKIGKHIETVRGFGYRFSED